MATTHEAKLVALPPEFAGTRVALHLVAEEIVAPARKPDNEIALEATPGGFGTPWFDFDGARRRVRVDGGSLVYEIDANSLRAPLRSLSAAAELVSPLVPDRNTDDAALEIDPAAAAVLAAWYALAGLVLGRLVAEAAPEDEPSPPRLWPEHFDLAIELGSEAAGMRANYGFSPGDAEHPEPYIYVGPWSAGVSGELWQARGFDGAELGYAELLEADDPAGAAFEFCRARKEALIRTTEVSR